MVAVFGWEFKRRLTEELLKLGAAFGFNIARQMCSLICPLELKRVLF